jgi:diguanylate cyclase (GGDEF)-like protein
VVANVLSAHGNPDVVGRTGGEEFALFFRWKSNRGLLDAADIIRTALHSTELQDFPDDHRVTISIGIHVRQGNESLTQMMFRADAAMYTAKRLGKDRAVMSQISIPAQQPKQIVQLSLN